MQGLVHFCNSLLSSSLDQSLFVLCLLPCRVKGNGLVVLCAALQDLKELNLAGAWSLSDVRVTPALRWYHTSATQHDP